MRILLLASLLFFSFSASAGLYKWVDENGNVHYSQKRPFNHKFQRLKAPPKAPENSTPLYQTPTSKSGTKDGTSKNNIKEESENNLKLRAENCERAKKNLQIYQIYRRIKDEDGKVKRLDEKERQKRIANNKQAISEFCE